MNENWWIFIIEGLAITIIGSLLHFTYEWTGRNKFIATFAAVNESTWEHVKLALSGIFLCTLVDMWFLGDAPNYWFAKAMVFLTPVVVIPVLFYSYRALLKVKSCLPIDIGLFIVASFASVAVFLWFLELPPMNEGGQIASMVIITVILVAYLLLTRFPLHQNFLFEDPITHTYGYEGEKKWRSKRRK